MDTCGLSRRIADTLGGPVTVTVPPLRRLRWRDGLLVADFPLLSGQTVDQVETAADPLRVTVGAHRIKIIPNAAVTACSIAWTFGDPLTDPIPITVPDPDTPVDDLTALWLGVTEDGTDWLHQVRVPTFAGGASGSGKSSLMQGQLIQLGPAIKTGLVEACGIDLKCGVELAFAAPMLTRYATKPLEAVVLLEQLEQAMEARLERQAGIARDHTPTLAEPLVLIFIDELAALTAYLTDRDLVRRAETALSRLLSAGRAAGYIPHGFVQDPRKETVKMRHLFLQAVGLRLREREEVAMVLSDGALAAGAWCHKIPRVHARGRLCAVRDRRPAGPGPRVPGHRRRHQTGRGALPRPTTGPDPRRRPRPNPDAELVTTGTDQPQIDHDGGGVRAGGRLMIRIGDALQQTITQLRTTQSATGRVRAWTGDGGWSVGGVGAVRLPGVVGGSGAAGDRRVGVV